MDGLGPALRTAPGTLITLQRQPLTGEIELLSSIAGRRVHDFSSANDDLEEMLALLASLDE